MNVYRFQPISYAELLPVVWPTLPSAMPYNNIRCLRIDAIGVVGNRFPSSQWSERVTFEWGRLEPNLSMDLLPGKGCVGIY